jgi:1-acyl-sn-glycerol-3-phosphate acyltransferase
MREKREWILAVIKFLTHLLAVIKLLAFVIGTLILVFFHTIWYLITHRLDVTMLFHRWCCFVFNIKIKIIGQNAHRKDHPVIYLANHVSYLDVIILGSILDGCFVAKSEVAGWPGFGMLAKLQKTIFIVREKSALMQSRESIAKAMMDDNDIILFPEGTSTDGWDVMQFKAGLLGIFFPDDKSSAGDYAIIDNALIQPIAIKHSQMNRIIVTRERQDLRDLYAWYGDMELAPHLWDFAHMLSCEVEIHMLEPLSVKDFSSRFDIANEAQLRVAKALKGA